MAVMGLLKSIQSSRWQYWGYGRGYNLEDGSNGIMEEDIFWNVAVMGLWMRIQSIKWQ